MIAYTGLCLSPWASTPFDWGNDGVQCKSDVLEYWERFRFEGKGTWGWKDGRIALRGGKDGKYCSDDQGRGRMVCNRDQALRDEVFTYSGDESKGNGFSYPWHVNYTVEQSSPPNLHNTAITLKGGNAGKY